MAALSLAGTMMTGCGSTSKVNTGTTATPTFSPAVGTYATAQTVTISDSTVASSIYYTTDGSVPSPANGNLYLGPITVSATETINAIGIAGVGYANSPVVAGVFTILTPAATPKFSLAAGTYGSIQTVSITDTTTGVAIYYTTDGSTPSATNGTLYAAPITVPVTETIKAIAIASGYNNSAVATAIYTISIVKPKVSGAVFSGTSAVAGASVQLYAAGQSGYGSAATPIGSPVTTATDGTGDFSISYTCPANSYAYLIATGGTSDNSTPNNALALMAGLGVCNSLGLTTSATINEVTTVATVTALQQFMSATYGTAFAESVGTSPTNITGLAGAFAAIPQMVNLSTGAALATSSSVATVNNTSVTLSWVSESSKIDTLGNILSYCGTTGDTAGSSPTISSQCATLFNSAKPATQANAPADTIQTMLDLAQNPTNTGPFTYASSSPVFTPALSTAPNDWTLNLSYYSDTATTYPPSTGKASYFLAQSYSLAVDGNDVVWIVGSGSISAISPGGVPSAQVLNNTVSEPRAIAFDTNNNLYVVNYGAATTGAILEYTGSTTPISYTTTSAYKLLYTLAIDGRNNIFAGSQVGAGTSPDFVVEVPAGSPTGTTVSLVQPVGKLSYGLAIDSSYNLWAAAQQAGLGGANAVTEIVCSGTTSCTYPNAGTSYTGGTSTGEMYEPFGIGIDSNGDPWIANGDTATTYKPGTGPYDGNHLTKLTPGSPTMGTGTTSGNTTPGIGGINDPEYLAIDGASNIWVANNGIGGGDTATDVSEFSNAGVALSGPNGFLINVGSNGTVVPGASTAGQGSRGIAIDGSGNVWVTNLLGLQNTNGSAFGVTELVGAAVPAVTPLSVGVKNNTLGKTP